MNAEDILTPDLGDLEFLKNQHLFIWPADLLVGDGEAIGVALDAIAEPSFASFQYRQRGDKQAPLGWQNRPDQEPHGGFDEIRAMQARIHQGNTDEEVPDAGFSRPNPAAFFEAMQAAIAAPQFKVDSLQSPELSPFDVKDSPEYIEGVAWAIAMVTREVMDMEQNLLQPDLCHRLGVEGATQVAIAHMRRFARLHGVVKHFRGHELLQLLQAGDRKVSKIREQILLWAEAGRQGVVMPDGEIHQPATLVNAATALAGLHHLTEMVKAIASFCAGAERASQCLVDYLPETPGTDASSRLVETNPGSIIEGRDAVADDPLSGDAPLS